MMEGREPRQQLPASAEALEKRQLRILESIASFELRFSSAAKLESSGGGDVALENGDEHRVSKQSCDGEVSMNLRDHRDI